MYVLHCVTYIRAVQQVKTYIRMLYCIFYNNERKTIFDAVLLHKPFYCNKRYYPSNKMYFYMDSFIVSFGLQRMQNRAVCTTCGLQKYDHVSQHRANIGWFPVSECVQYRIISQHYLGEGILPVPT